MNNNDLEIKSKQSNWPSIIDRHILTVIKSFNSALPTLFIWISIPLCLLIVGLALQRGIPQRTSTNSGNALKTIEFTSEPDDTLILFISYPKELLIQPLGTPQAQSISLWLEYATPTFGPSPTVTVTSSPSKTLEPTHIPTNNTNQSGSAAQSSQIIESPIVDSYKVYLLANSNDVVFVDQTGIAIPHYQILTPSDRDITPAVLYVQPLPGNGGETEIGVSINNAPVEKETKIPLDVETSIKSFLRQIGMQICGTPLFIGALITALTGFAIQDWNKRTEDWKKQQEDEKEVNREINILTNKLINNQSNGSRYYLDLINRPELLWKKLEVKDRLDSVIKQHASFDLYILTQLWNVRNNNREYSKFKEFIKYEDLINLLGRASKSENLDTDWQSRARYLSDRLGEPW